MIPVQIMLYPISRPRRNSYPPAFGVNDNVKPLVGVPRLGIAEGPYPNRKSAKTWARDLERHLKQEGRHWARSASPVESGMMVTSWIRSPTPPRDNSSDSDGRNERRMPVTVRRPDTSEESSDKSYEDRGDNIIRTGGARPEIALVPAPSRTSNRGIRRSRSRHSYRPPQPYHPFGNEKFISRSHHSPDM